jgi:hypothetical protein
MTNPFRQAGFVPLPHLWIHTDDLTELKQLTDRRRDQMNAVRKQANPESSSDYGPFPFVSQFGD